MTLAFKGAVGVFTGGAVALVNLTVVGAERAFVHIDAGSDGSGFKSKTGKAGTGESILHILTEMVTRVRSECTFVDVHLRAIALHPAAAESFVASAGKGLGRVGAKCVGVAIVAARRTFVDKRVARRSVPGKAFVASARKSVGQIRTCRICVAIMSFDGF